MILAGDIGGTNARLGLFELAGSRLRVIAAKTYPSRQHTGLEEIVELFMAGQHGPPSRACFAIAGPVAGGRAVTTNFPWVVDTLSLGKLLGLADVGLINDLEAIAHGLDELEEKDVAVLDPGRTGVEGNRAIIAAGTGLGEAGAYWDGRQHHPFACEGGHAGFAPRTSIEIDLLRWLLARFDRVSYERVLSGAGLYEIYKFLRDRSGHEEPSWLSEELVLHPAPVVIVQHAFNGRSELCWEAVQQFVSIYGAEAGNLALKIMARGGVWIGGGIAPRVLPQMPRVFREAFDAKGRMRPLVEGMQVNVILNDRVGLLGAARYATSRG